MRKNVTEIERLDAKQTGLKLFVDLRLDHHARLIDIQQELQQKYKVRVALSTISSYKQCRWQVRNDRIQSITDQTEAMIAIVGKHGLDKRAKAYLFEELQRADQERRPVQVATILREQAKLAKIELEREKLRLSYEELKNKTREVELKAEQLLLARQEVQGVVGDKTINAEQAIAQIRDIYGIDPKHQRGGSTLSLPEKVGGG